MRTIKFRGKRKDNGQWVFGSLLVDADGCCFIFPTGTPISPNPTGPWFIEVEPETAGQFAGLKDMSKKEIFEGDIVRGHVHKYVVRWNNREARFDLEIVYECEMEGFHQTHEQFPLDGMFLTVKGNIYDNPELIPQPAQQ